MKNEYIVAIDYSANYKPLTIDYNRDECYWQIDRAFEEERISFEDHELLYGLAGMVEVA